MADFTGTLIAHIELQLRWQGAMHALIEAFKSFYDLDDKAVRCTLMSIVEDLGKTRKGRLILKGEKAIATIVSEFRKKEKQDKIVYDCDLSKYIEAKGQGNDSMVRAR